ncbi:MAG: hypothetical protein PWP68_1692 [Rikenellaceae bacterium]|nr:hypothetical protein [Rikenellaceae bacterium]
MKKVNLLLISVIFILLSSCNTMHLNQKYTYLNKVPVNSQVKNFYTDEQSPTKITNHKLSFEKINDNLATKQEMSSQNAGNTTNKLFTKRQVNFNKIFNSLNPFTPIEANHFKQQLNTVDSVSTIDTNILAKVLIGLLILSLILIILDLILPGEVFSIISTIILILILIYGIYFLFQLL